MALDALGIVLEGRLRRSLREALRGTYGVEVEANATKIPEPRYSVTIEFGCDPERTEELVATLLREVERLKAEGPTESEVADAREALMVAYQTDMAENSRLADRLLERYQFSRGRDGVLQPARPSTRSSARWGSRTRRAGVSTRATTCGSRCSRRPRRA